MEKPNQRNEPDGKEKNKNVAAAPPRPSSEAEEAPRSEPDQAQGARRRAMSVASTHPAVETIVTRAKRAASSLWTLLHAQHCTIVDGCIHPGCREAKLLHLHLKTCPAGLSFPCPTNHNGCIQSRQLLAHYKRCRSIRAKQLGQAHLRRDLTQQQLCLVCNLVGRQARQLLEGGRPSSSAPPRCNAVASASATVRKTSSRRIISSFMLDSSNNVVEIPSHKLMPPPKMMPPPPPRARASSSLSAAGATQGTGPPALSHSYPPQAQAMPVTTTGSNEDKVVKTVSFHPGTPSRGRAYSHSEGHPSPQALQRPRSQSLGAALVQGGHAHAKCDTIDEEEVEGEPPADLDAWDLSS